MSGMRLSEERLTNADGHGSSGADRGQTGVQQLPTTPTNAKRRGFGLFAGRNGSNESSLPPSPPSPVLTYQPRIKHPKESNDIKQRPSHHDQSASAPSDGHHSRPDSAPPTPKARNTDSQVSAKPSHIKRASLGKLHIADSALARRTSSPRKDGGSQKGGSQDLSRESLDAREADGTLQTAVPMHWRRQSDQVGGGEASAKRADRFSHLRKYSWGHPLSPTSSATTTRQAPKRSLSSPLDLNATAERRESIGGAKPVTPSFHMDAPPELKVKPPTNSVLLPYLSIPGVNGTGKEVESTTCDFKVDEVMQSASIKHQRPAIKVRIITWNQGSSVPKGNLEVLLGRVGEYIPPQEGWDESSGEEEESNGKLPGDKARKHRGMGVAGQEKVPRKERIPPLPHDDGHPYHVVVVAGQECPWGDGKRIATGVGLAGELGDLGRSKSRASQFAKEKSREGALRERREGGKASKDGEVGGVMPDEKGLTSAVESEFPFSDFGSRTSAPTTPLIPTTPGAGAGWGIGGKGWSDMCEDWLCRGPLAQATATKGLAQASKAGVSPSPLLSPIATPDEGPSRATTPKLVHSSSSHSITVQNLGQDETTPAKTKASGGLATSKHGNVAAQDHFYSSPVKRSTLAVPRNIGRSLSFVTRSREALDVSAPIEEKHEDELDPLCSSPISRPVSPLKQSIDANVRLPAQNTNKPQSDKSHHRLGLHIPGLSAPHHVTVQNDGTPLSLGAYELVAKERCYMMYMAVYVWRGCLDRVAKTSQGHVKSGLLAGRVGNKGAVGISLKLGSSRLLFVNAHLAAHEGKVAERVANVEKIKKELKIDTFLAEDDPRNKADDLTTAFDYAFWFGDLNFRVDISRQHADWLLMKKQYHDALAFDQLKRIMKEQPWVFNGFQEAPITFPPTFKYDVLKTIKQKREEKTKRHRSGPVWPKAGDWEATSMVVGKGSGLTSSTRGSQGSDLGTSPSSALGSGWASRSNGRSRGNSSEQAIRESRRGEGAGEDDTSSISSSGWGGSGLSTSGGHLSDRDENNGSSSYQAGISDLATPSLAIDPVVSSNTTAAEGHKMHGKAIKVKKRFFDVVNAISPHSHREREEQVPPLVAAARERAGEGKQQKESDNVKDSHHDAALRRGSDRQGPSSTRHTRAESYSTVSKESGSPRKPMMRRRSSAGDIRPEQEEQKGASGSAMKPSSSSITAMAEEYERQPYDTSAKQRVPSWCDRVLWKSNITVEEEVDRQEEREGGAVDSSPGIQSRMGTAISNALNSHRRGQYNQHPKMDNSPTVTFAPRLNSRARPPGRSAEEASTSFDGGRQSSPALRRRWFNKRRSSQEMKRANTMGLDEGYKALGPEKMEKRTFSAIDLPSELERGNLLQQAKRPPIQTRRSSLEVPRRRVQSGRHPVREEHETLQQYARNLSASQAITTDPHPLSSLHSPPSSSHAVKSAPPQSDGNQRRSSWWNDHVGIHLPSFLTPQGAMAALSHLSSRGENSISQVEEEPGELIGPKRGQIECLLYKSLDDREMRLLEGRSDHRPVVWVGNVGV